MLLLPGLPQDHPCPDFSCFLLPFSWLSTFYTSTVFPPFLVHSVPLSSILLLLLFFPQWASPQAEPDPWIHESMKEKSLLCSLLSDPLLCLTYFQARSHHSWVAVEWLTGMTDWHPSHRKSGQTVTNPIKTLSPHPCWPLGTAFINMYHGCSPVTDDLIQLGICLNNKKLQRYGRKTAFLKYLMV